MGYGDYLRQQIAGGAADVENAASESERDIAVVGMATRFPKAPDLQAFWRLLIEGRDAVDEIPAARWDWREYFDADPEAPGESLFAEGPIEIYIKGVQGTHKEDTHFRER